MSLRLPARYQYTGKKLSGGMGDVLICDDSNLDRKVAIKIIKTPADKNRMLDEISAFEELRSKHVVEIFDIIKFGETSYGIVQDYIPGYDVQTFAKTANLSGENYLKILYQIACGLSDIHKIGRIHRDIKPNNIKFDQENLLKIFDFGLSRTTGIDSETKGFRGTLGFAAPELFIEGTVAFTEKIDVYAFGATAYYIAEKGLPSEFLKMPPSVQPGKNYFSGLSVPDLPNKLSVLLNSCFAIEPSSRPSMQDVSDIISRYLLFRKHKATLCWGTTSYMLDNANNEIRAHRDGIGAIRIEYDGLYFKAASVEGEVYINNSSVKNGDLLPGSCVVTIGNPERKNDRTYVTFDASYPEVVL